MPRAYWFVGAVYNGTDDQIERFYTDGIWENGYTDKYLDLVKSIQPGDRIAIKSTYTRKNGLPFENRGQSVSVMAIKATGIVTENLGDGRTVRVIWTPFADPREWYFFTQRQTIWHVLPGKWEWMTDALIEFSFNGQPQDTDRFRNAPRWRERYGDLIADKPRFRWTQFYEAMADKLLAFRHNRTALLAGLNEIASRVKGLNSFNDHYTDGTTGPLKDICPFTTLGIFNRGISDVNRKIIARELAIFLKIDIAVPDSFEGIPILNNMKSWYFYYESGRRPDDIERLWDVFAAAIQYADISDADASIDEAEAKAAFIRTFDEANRRQGVGWNLSIGLYWIRPWEFLSLDQRSQVYITKKLGVQFGLHGPKNRSSATDYLAVTELLKTRFQEEAYPAHSFPELSLAAWLYKDGEVIVPPVTETDPPVAVPPIVPYTVDDILAEGCFLERAQLEKMLIRLHDKKNLILQGPPGTGKTWLAKRLACALMGQRDDRRVRALQFHPNLSYEDFVRGWRPTGDGKLSLVDGPFLETVRAASNNPAAQYIVVIEEINRGNPAQIFGEMLTLLETDKRTPTEALELCYRRDDAERVFIPGNVYVIGTMNIADRSLALVDLALRRRFAFIDLAPTFGPVWRNWVTSQYHADSGLVGEIETRMLALNVEIAGDSRLGPQFRIGHSYVTPPLGTRITDTREWFRQVVETEIGPLLDEYWFDDLPKAQQARQRLLEGF